MSPLTEGAHCCNELLRVGHVVEGQNGLVEVEGESFNALGRGGGDAVVEQPVGRRILGDKLGAAANLASRSLSEVAATPSLYSLVTFLLS